MPDTPAVHTVTIKSVDAEHTLGGQIELNASLTPPDADASWVWERVKGGSMDGNVDLVGDGTSSLKDIVESEGPWTYRAKAMKGTTKLDDDVTTVDVKPAGVVGPAPTPAAPSLEWRPAFAVLAGVIVVAIMGLFIWQGNLLGLSVTVSDKAAESDPRAALAARVIGPVLLISVVLISAGLWMLLLEWRGGFAAHKLATEKKKGIDVVEFVKAIGDLKGANLVFVGGLVGLLTVAWMVGAAAGADPAGPGDAEGTTPSTSASSSASSVPSSAPPTTAR